MKNFLVWIVLISTAALGVAVAQPTTDDYAAATKMIPYASEWQSPKA